MAIRGKMRTPRIRQTDKTKSPASASTNPYIVSREPDRNELKKTVTRQKVAKAEVAKKARDAGAIASDRAKEAVAKEVGKGAAKKAALSPPIYHGKQPPSDSENIEKDTNDTVGQNTTETVDGTRRITKHVLERKKGKKADEKTKGKLEKNSAQKGADSPSHVKKNEANAPGNANKVAKKNQAQKAARNTIRKNEAKKIVAASQKKSAELSKKAAEGAVKGVSSGVKALLAAGAPVIVVILIIVVVVVVLVGIIMSPMGTFVSGNNEDNPNPIGQMMADANAAFQAEIDALKAEYEAQGYIVNVDYNSDDNNVGAAYNNWRDIIAMFIVTADKKLGDSMLEFSDADKAAMVSMFQSMNTYNVRTYTGYVLHTEYADGRHIKQTFNSQPTIPTDLPEGSTAYIETIQYADIGVYNKHYFEIKDGYNLTKEQNDFLDFLMSSESLPLWETLFGDIADTITVPGDIDINLILKDLPYDEIGSRAVAVALTRLGTPYSLGGSGGTIDCSGLTRWTYEQLGIFVGWSAADQAQNMVHQGKAIDGANAMPGDLIFWSYPSNPRVKDRFMAIGHVAIYAGNGMMVEAAPSAGCVTYRAVSVQGTPVLWARPY